jgi:hypothetical protein
MLKLPRTIRLDPSDIFVFERAADPGEWAVSGDFVFGTATIQPRFRCETSSRGFRCEYSNKHLNGPTHERRCNTLR